MSVMKDSEYCYVHNPAISEDKKREGRIKGGSRKKSIIQFKLESDIIKLETIQDVKIFLSNMINSILKSELDIKTATGVNYIIQSIIKIIQLDELEKRLKRLEDAKETDSDNVLNFDGWGVENQ
jgi:hypothetical protein